MNKKISQKMKKIIYDLCGETKSAKVVRCLERKEHAWCLTVPHIVGKLTMRAEADGKLKKHGERFSGKGKSKSESEG